MNDLLHLGGKDFTSRLILGSGKFSLDLITAVIEEGGGEIITLALRRANPDGAEDILSHIPEGVTLLPNTSGARNAEEAVRQLGQGGSHQRQPLAAPGQRRNSPRHKNAR